MVTPLVSNDGDQPWNVLGLDLAEPCQGHHAIIQPGTGHSDGHQRAHSIDPQMARAPVDVLAAIIPVLDARSGGWPAGRSTQAACRVGQRPAATPWRSRKALTHRGPVSSSRHGANES